MLSRQAVSGRGPDSHEANSQVVGGCSMLQCSAAEKNRLWLWRTIAQSASSPGSAQLSPGKHTRLERHTASDTETCT